MSGRSMSYTLEHHYDPRGAAVRILESRAPEVLASGPAGTGKSRACLEKLLLACLTTSRVKCLIVRKTATSLTTSALSTWEEFVVPEALSTGAVKFFSGSRRVPPQYQFYNGSVVNIGGMDQPTRIMSTEYDLAFVQEAIELTVDDWEAITSRLRNGRLSFQQLLADTNPSMPTHWLKERCNRGDCLLLESRHADNPRLCHPDGTPTEYGADYLARLDRLTGVRYQRLRKGLWVAAEGIIMEDWDPSVHVVPRFEIPQEWTRWWAVDFGYTHAFVLQCWAEDGDGRMYLYRELFHSRKTVDQHARDIMNIVKPDGKWSEPAPRAIVCDHDAEGREVLAREVGIGTIPADKRVTVGIQAVQRRMRPAGDGKPRIFLMKDSVVTRDQELIDFHLPTCTEEEVPGYVWSVKPGGELREEPRKENDDGMDAMRYIIAHRDLGSPRIRVM